MRTVTIICKCRKLVDVVDNKISLHSDNVGAYCNRSGERYVPSPRATPEAGRNIEVLGTLELPCAECGEPMGVTVAVDRGPAKSGDRPEWTGPASSAVN